MLKSISARVGALITANCVAALAVAALTLAGILIVTVASPGDGGVSSVIAFAMFLGLFAALYSFAISFPVFLAGLIVVGVPTWWLLHRAGLRTRGAFVVVAATESVIAGALFFRVFAPGSEVVALLLAIPGGLAGWAIRTYGYAPIRPPPARPS